MEFEDVLRRRKMVRAFRPDPIPPDVLHRVMSSVLHAPSAGFTQGNEFLVLTNPDAVADYFRLTDDPLHPLSPDERDVLAPVVVVPMANEAAYVARYSQPDKIAFGLDTAAAWPAPFWTIDAGMASMLVLLAAVEHGLGALFAGISHGEAEMRSRFRVPQQFRPIGVIHVGYPAHADPISAGSSARTRPRRSVDTLMHYDSW